MRTHTPTSGSTEVTLFISFMFADLDAAHNIVFNTGIEYCNVYKFNCNLNSYEMIFIFTKSLEVPCFVLRFCLVSLLVPSHLTRGEQSKGEMCE